MEVVDLWVLVYLSRVYAAGQNAMGSKNRHASNEVTDVGKEILKMGSLTWQLFLTVFPLPDLHKVLCPEDFAVVENVKGRPIGSTLHIWLVLFLTIKSLMVIRSALCDVFFFFLSSQI